MYFQTFENFVAEKIKMYQQTHVLNTTDSKFQSPVTQDHKPLKQDFGGNCRLFSSGPKPRCFVTNTLGFSWLVGRWAWLRLVSGNTHQAIELDGWLDWLVGYSWRVAWVAVEPDACKFGLRAM